MASDERPSIEAEVEAIVERAFPCTTPTDHDAWYMSGARTACREVARLVATRMRDQAIEVAERCASNGRVGETASRLRALAVPFGDKG